MNALAYSVLLVLLLPVPVSAWAQIGHHVIPVMAFNLLSDSERAELIAILRTHPRFAEDFTPPEGTRDLDRWYIGRAGYWPDVARRLGEQWDRPTWHSELGWTLIIGDEATMDIPSPPGPLPPDATLKTQNLYASQAIELCRRVLADTSQPNEMRAVAVTWLAHLVADIHQPCHSGAMYVEKAFPEGDRNANKIPVRQASSLHSAWDGLLGRQYDRDAVNRQVAEIASDAELMANGRMAAVDLDPLTWIRESREAAIRATYTDEVLEPVLAVSRGLAVRIPPIDLSQDYLKNAAAVARVRAAQAAHRLAAVWREALR